MKTALSAAIIAVAFLLPEIPIVAQPVSDLTEYASKQADQVLDRAREAREKAEEKRKEALEFARQRREEAMERADRQVDSHPSVKINRDTCKNKQPTIEHMIPSLNQSAKSIKQSLDTIHSRLQNLHKSRPATTPDYDVLASAAKSAKLNAETSLRVLEESSFTLDCTSENTATLIQDYQTAVSDTKESLKTYRAALVQLISAMRSVNDRETSSENS